MIAIAGASGFVGRALINQLSNDPGIGGSSIIALSRGSIEGLPPGVTTRQVDLFSSESTHAALRGVETAIYLVHSMLPSTALFQGSFHDTDLLLADNFARACAANGVKRVIYLGGLVPSGHISLHLESRREVEGVLRSAGAPVTVLRAGMIVGPGGSSFELLQQLVQRLPVMLLPAWTQRQTQAVFIDDVVDVIRTAITGPEFEGKTLDLVNGEPLKYETLLRQMAQALGLRRRMLHVPIDSTGFSKLWVSLFGRSSYALVSPLIDSLKCDLPAGPPRPEIAGLIRFKDFRSMVRESLHREAATPIQRNKKKRSRAHHTVRSIQRLPAVHNHDCRWIATQYMRWLPRMFRSLIQVSVDETSGRVLFHVLLIPWPMLVLQAIDGQSFKITGGLLSAAQNRGWLEFRQIEDRKYTLAAIHDFVPALPWPIYLLTQAPLHAWVMKRFGRSLGGGGSEP